MHITTIAYHRQLSYTYLFIVKLRVVVPAFEIQNRLEMLQSLNDGIFQWHLVVVVVVVVVVVYFVRRTSRFKVSSRLHRIDQFSFNVP